MQIYQRPLLESFQDEYPDSRLPIDCWQLEADAAAWTGPKDVKKRYKTAEVSPNRIVFNLDRGRFCLQVMVRYERGILLIEDLWLAKSRSKVMH